MKTLKITLALVAIAMLTVSGVQSETAIEIANEEKLVAPVNIDLLAHKGKAKIKLPTQG